MTDSPDEPAAPQPEAAAPTTEPVPQKPKRVALLAVIAATVVILDLLTKIIMVATVTPGESVRASSAAWSTSR